MSDQPALIEDGEWNPRVALQAAVDAAYADYVPEPDGDYTGKVVAIRCRDKKDAKHTVAALENAGFEAERTEHDGTWYAWVSDLRGTDPDDAVFEIGWYNFDVGTIPDPRIAE